MLCIRETKSGFVSLHGKEDKKQNNPQKTHKQPPYSQTNLVVLLMLMFPYFWKKKSVLLIPTLHLTNVLCTNSEKLHSNLN